MSVITLVAKDHYVKLKATPVLVKVGDDRKMKVKVLPDGVQPISPAAVADFELKIATSSAPPDFR